MTDRHFSTSYTFHFKSLAFKSGRIHCERNIFSKPKFRQQSVTFILLKKKTHIPVSREKHSNSHKEIQKKMHSHLTALVRLGLFITFAKAIKFFSLSSSGGLLIAVCIVLQEQRKTLNHCLIKTSPTPYQFTSQRIKQMHLIL